MHDLVLALSGGVGGALVTAVSTFVRDRRTERAASIEKVEAALCELEDRLMERFDRVDDRVRDIAERQAGTDGVVNALLGFHDPSSRPPRKTS